jgi:hypothetical protein
MAGGGECPVTIAAADWPRSQMTGISLEPLAALQRLPLFDRGVRVTSVVPEGNRQLPVPWLSPT